MHMLCHVITLYLLHALSVCTMNYDVYMHCRFNILVYTRIFVYLFFYMCGIHIFLCMSTLHLYSYSYTYPFTIIRTLVYHVYIMYKHVYFYILLHTYICTYIYVIYICDIYTGVVGYAMTYKQSSFPATCAPNETAVIGFDM